MASEPLAVLWFPLDDGERFQSSGGNAGRLGGGVHIAAGKLNQVLDQCRIPRHESARGAQRFAQGADQDWHLLAIEACHAACAVFAEHAKPVGIVDHQPGAVLLADVGKFSDVSDIAIHTEYAVAHH